MNRTRWIISALALGVVVLWAFGSGSNQAASSVLSRGASGWHGFRAALEMQDRTVELKKIPWHGLFADEPASPDPVSPDADQGEEPELDPSQSLDPSAKVFVTSFPWQRTLGVEEGLALKRFLRAGGTVLVGYSGRQGGPSENEVLQILGMSPPEPLREGPPLAPLAWWSYRTQRWSLDPDTQAAEQRLPKLEVAAFNHAPIPPDGARISYRQPEDLLERSVEGERHDASRPLIFDYEYLGGRVFVVPAALWSNAEMLKAGNLSSLDHRLSELADRREWWVDEYHHGLVRADWVQQSTANVAWDTLMLHLAVIYALGVWALARRFGPVWQERAAQLGSTAEFLESLGALHHRLGHHQDAARQMADRVAELYSQSEESLPSPEGVDNGDALIRFARDLTLFQRFSRPR